MSTVFVAGACTSRPPTPAFVTDGGDADDAGDSDATRPRDSGAAQHDAGAAPPPTQDASLEAAGPAALVRAANFAPDSPAAGYDFCLAPHGTTAWQGPEVAAALGTVGSLGDAGTNGIQFPVVTNYLFFVAPGVYDAAIVAPGQGCGHPVAVATNLAALSTGTFYTLAMVGDAIPAGSDPALTAILLADDSTAPGGSANLRFLDAAPSVRSVEFGEGTLVGGTFLPLATNVSFGATGSAASTEAGTLDANGYASIAATGAGATLSAHAQGASTDLATASGLTPMPGDVDTIVLVGGKTGGAAPSLVVCTGDGVQNQSSGLISSCAFASM